MTPGVPRRSPPPYPPPSRGRERRGPLAAAALALCIALGGCTQVAPSANQRPGDREAPTNAVKKSLTAAVVTSDPAIFRASAGGPFGGSVPGVDALEDLVNAGASAFDDKGGLQPRLTEAVPSLENGLWKLLADGRMETIWRLRPNARWQDGTPVTAQDLLFTLQIARDPDMVAFGGHVGIKVIDSAEASDPRTLIVLWKAPFIEADNLFTTEFAMPMPAHLLERAYTEDKDRFTDLPYWNKEFVGAGPFKLKNWVTGSHLVLEAFDQYVLGRPKIDEIVVKFIPDPSTLIANFLSSEVEIILGRGISIEQAIDVRDQWRDGRMEVGLTNSWVVVYPQFINPSPPVIGGDARFRKALMHALDRQEMADSLQNGLTPVGDSIINTGRPPFQDLDSFVMRYRYDTRRAGQLLQDLGYIRGTDGLLRDAANERLNVEIRTTGEQDIQVKSMLSVADYWRKVGAGADTMNIPVQRQRDREYRATRPGFELLRTPDMAKGLRRAHGAETPLPENNFQKSGNNARYMNPEFDALLDRYFSTVPMPERLQVLGQIIRHSSDLVTVMGLFYSAEPALITNRLEKAAVKKGQDSTLAWNAHEWDLK